MKKGAKFLFLILAVIYFLSAAGLYFFQEELLFHPVKLPAAFQFHFDVPYQEVNFKLKDGGTINAIWFRCNRPKGAVLLLHGNSGNISQADQLAARITGRGYDCLIPDYPGYGKSTGTLNEASLFETAEVAYDFLRKTWPSDHIAIYGRSLGTGIATYQARKAGWCKALILEAPYSSIINVAAERYRWFPVRWLCRYKLLTGSYLKNVICPIFAIHGTADEVIPISESKALEALHLNNFHLLVVEGGGHNNLPNSPQYQQLMDSVLTP
ncbi:MAG: alpha/beta fold hydrolase [Chitinophagales bacterium]